MRKVIAVLLTVTSCLFLFPIAFTVANSFMTEQQISTQHICLVPDLFNLQQYYSLALYKGQYFKFFMNSIRLTFFIILGQTVVGLFAGFALAKLKSGAGSMIFMVYVLAVLLPLQITLVPNYLVYDVVERLLCIKLLDTGWAIILPGIFSTFGVFLLRQFIRGIPDEIIESARIDGASYIRILFSIILPSVKPAVFTLLVLTFIDNWNLIEQALIFIDSPDKLPLSVFLENIYSKDYKVFFAGAVLYIIPALIVFIKGEKYFKEGFAIGGLNNGK